MNILVTGATGFLGRHLMPVLRAAYPASQVTGVSSKDFDLMQPERVVAMFDSHRPDVLVHLAAYSGGIGANRDFPADFYYRNTVLTALTFEQAARFGIRKMIYTMGGCSYPATATSPIDEEQLWKGFPQLESSAYSTAKMMGTVASRAYRVQRGLSSVVLIPGNMYGEYDNFRTAESHVIPALIRRFYEAKNQGADEVAMWGTGKPVRDFVYAGDVARCIPYFIDHYDSSDPVNISSGTATTIKDVTAAIQAATEFTGRMAWDTTKPDGQMVKVFDVSRLKSLGLSCDTPFETGLQRTVAWFKRHYRSHGDGLRL